MVGRFEHKGWHFAADLTKGMDISIPLDPYNPGPSCFYSPPFRTEPVVAGQFIGDISAGGLVNFKNIFLNPHGNGTHTECVGHILDGPYTIHQCLTRFHYLAALLTVEPEVSENRDTVVTAHLLASQWEKYLGMGAQTCSPEVLIVRTTPNEQEKKQRDYSGTNPPYFTPEAIQWINDQGFDHLMTDLPSVDREEDDGRLAAHKAFWGVPGNIEPHKTITEMIYADDDIPDGIYLCLMQIISLQLDACPSKIVLFPITKTE